MALQERCFHRIRQFLGNIGISVSIAPLPADGFLAHTYIRGNHIFCKDTSEETLGEILHEAGHIATIPSFLRPLIDGDVESPEILAAAEEYCLKARAMSFDPDADPTVRAIIQADDVSATAWSYAAAIAADVPPELLIAGPSAFGGQGSESAEAVLIGLKTGHYIGINSLAASKMTFTKGWARCMGAQPFPHMQRWLQI